MKLEICYIKYSLFSLIILFFIKPSLISATHSADKDQSGFSKTEEISSAKREYRIAFEYCYLFRADALESTFLTKEDYISYNAILPQNYFGIYAYFGYIISPRSVMGVNCSYRLAKGSNIVKQFIIGSMSKLYFSTNKKVLYRPYFLYAFQYIKTYIDLKNNTNFKDNPGTHSSFSTGFGTDISDLFFFEAIYVLTRFAVFGNNKKTNFDHIRFVVGYRI